MRKLIFSLTLLTIPHGYSLGSVQENCSSLSSEVKNLANFSRSIWKPSFNSNCKKEDVPKECTKYIERLEKAKKDWRSYSKTCALENTLLQTSASCFNGVQELKNFLIENATQQALINAEDKKCSENRENKIAIIATYNGRNPELLKYKNSAAIKNLLKRNCLEIKNFLLGYQKNTRQKLTLTIPQPNSGISLSAEQQEYLTWQEKMIKPYQIGEPFWKEIPNLIKDKIQDSQCMSTYRLNEVICRTTLSFVFNTAITRAGQMMLNEARIAKLVEQELEMEKLANIELSKKQSLGDYAFDLVEQRDFASRTLLLADEWSNAASAAAEVARAEYIRNRFAKLANLEDPIKYNATPISDGQKKLISKINEIQKNFDQEYYKKLQGNEVVGFNSKGQIPGRLVKYDDNFAYIESLNSATNAVETYKLNFSEFMISPKNDYNKIAMPN